MPPHFSIGAQAPSCREPFWALRRPVADTSTWNSEQPQFQSSPASPTAEVLMARSTLPRLREPGSPWRADDCVCWVISYPTVKLTAECTRESKDYVSVEPERLGTKATPSKVLATVPLERTRRYRATGTCTGRSFYLSQSSQSVSRVRQIPQAHAVQGAKLRT